MENSTFLNETSIVKYSAENFEKEGFKSIDTIILEGTESNIRWLNTYGINYQTEFNQVIQNNKLDDFLVRLLREEEHQNKVILLDNLFFVGIRVLKTDNFEIDSEQMIFICSTNYIWSIQEKHGDYFDWIRERLEANKGIARKKKADYLLFLILESIVDNYQKTYQKLADKSSEKLAASKVSPTPEFTEMVEARKQELFSLKKASTSLRDIIIKMEKVEIKDFKFKYFSELKEQVNNLIQDIDFELQELESKINLIFSIQGHRLNEVMKTLTIFSVIFIPLTFLAGIYGMNFVNMPELETKYGYYILLSIMAMITVFSVWYFSRKKWF